VRSLLQRGMLWGLRVENACHSSESRAEFRSTSSGLRITGEWDCAAQSDTTLRIRTSYMGMWEGCHVDADCMEIPCATRCMPCSGPGCDVSDICTPDGPGCVNETTVEVSLEDFKTACPPDPRDEICTHIEQAWHDAHCQMLVESDLGLLPDAKTKATQCLCYVEQYSDCVAQFEGEYAQHRAVPKKIIEMLGSIIINGTAGARCASIPTSLANQISAVRCGPGATSMADPTHTTYEPAR